MIKKIEAIIYESGNQHVSTRGWSTMTREPTFYPISLSKIIGGVAGAEIVSWHQGD